ncbi:MAG: hypothetical protein C0467_20695 [Planctomycetaceae bacterium]|nr:hypothetical protein [Planctomycetaceae bacterium]
MRTFLRAVVTVAVVVVSTNNAFADRIGPSPVSQRALMADVVVVGKVVGFEKELVQAAPYPGAKEKVGYKIATIKIDTGLIGADKLKEIKVGFIPPKALAVGGQRGFFGFELKEGQELVLFLAKHPAGDFHVIPGAALPVDLKEPQSKMELEIVQSIANVLADPMKALKSDTPGIRGEAAAVVIQRYRRYPALGGEVQEVVLGADESKLLLKSLTEASWSRGSRASEPQGALHAFHMLGLTAKDGWVQPVIVNNPGAPPVDYGEVHRDAFGKWLEGPGKDYKIKKIVPKTQK